MSTSYKSGLVRYWAQPTGSNALFWFYFYLLVITHVVNSFGLPVESYQNFRLCCFFILFSVAEAVALNILIFWNQNVCLSYPSSHHNYQEQLALNSHLICIVANPHHPSSSSAIGCNNFFLAHLPLNALTDFHLVIFFLFQCFLSNWIKHFKRRTMKVKEMDILKF